METTPPRWEDYFLTEKFSEFWTERAKDQSLRVLIVLGIGFDPRCLIALKSLIASGLGNRLGYMALRLVPQPSLGAAGTLIDNYLQKNTAALDALTGCHREAVYDVETHDLEGHNVVGRKTLAAMTGASSIFSKYTDVIVDISGMPRGAFYPLIAYLLKLADANTFKNLHSAVVEDSDLDAKISGREYGQADFAHTFRLQTDNKLVWIPAIGGNATIRLDKIHAKISGSCIETCPILPFPGRSLRRIDDIVIKHAEILFETISVTHENLLLCDEETPFDIYRKILDVEKYYREQLGALQGMGAITTVVSPLSSKTLSLGMLLAAIERVLPVCLVEAGAYQVDINESEWTSYTVHEPTEIWLAGEPYLP